MPGLFARRRHFRSSDSQKGAAEGRERGGKRHFNDSSYLNDVFGGVISYRNSLGQVNVEGGICHSTIHGLSPICFVSHMYFGIIRTNASYIESCRGKGGAKESETHPFDNCDCEAHELALRGIRERNEHGSTRISISKEKAALFFHMAACLLVVGWMNQLKFFSSHVVSDDRQCRSCQKIRSPTGNSAAARRGG